MPNNSTEGKVFELLKDTDIKIYGVGELIYNFADVAPKYYFKGDDIEMFFLYLNPATGKKEVRRFIFPFSDTYGTGGGKEILTLGNGVHLSGIVIDKKIAHNKFYTEIKYPWKALGIKKITGQINLGLEVALGDCDDHFKQKGKIAWVSQAKDPLYEDVKTYGKLIIGKVRNNHIAPLNFYSFPRTNNIHSGESTSWTYLPAIHINHTVMGETQNRYDLSASIRSCWDKDSLYFSIDILDQKMVKIKKGEIENERTFADYGWIENEKGVKIWEMNALHSTYAGGAFKNNKVDTTLHLKAGKYVLKYITDESHSYNNWDSPPPTTSFYGIVIYNR
jgi:hypothetical protein